MASNCEPFVFFGHKLRASYDNQIMEGELDQLHKDIQFQYNQIPQNQIPPTPAPPPEPVVQKSGLTELFGTVLIVLGVLIFLALVSFQYQISQDKIPQSETNLIGTAGHYTAQLLFYLFGKSCFLSGPYFFLLGILTIFRGGFSDPLSRLLALITLMMGSSLLGGLIFIEGKLPSEMAGGLISVYLGGGFVTLFGFYGALVLALGIFITGLFLSIRIPVPVLMNMLNNSLSESLQKYAAIFTNNIYVPKPHAKATTSRQLDSESPLLANKSVDKKQTPPPWIEKVIVNESPHQNQAKVSAAHDQAMPAQSDENPGHNDFSFLKADENSKTKDWLGNQKGSVKDIQIHANRDFFGSQQSQKGPAHTSPGDLQFEGYFSQNDTRFHFQTSPSMPSSIQSKPIYDFEPVTKKPADLMRSFDKKPAQYFDKGPLMRPINLDVLPEVSRRENPNSQKTARADVPRDLGYSHDLDDAGYGNDEEAEDHIDSDDYDFNDTDEAAFLNPQSHSDQYDEEISDESLEYIEEIDSMDYDTAEPGSPESVFTNPDEDFDQDENDEDLTDRTEASPSMTGIPEFKQASSKYFIPYDILSKPDYLPLEKIENDISITRQRLEQVFIDYGIEASVVNTQRGPIITLYEIRPAPGVKVSRIQGISDEIKMNLEAQSIRIIAPIPGKSTVGIEIPNLHRESVALRDMVKSADSNTDGLSIVLGADINGSRIFTDLTKLPHLLIAGATGSGKSVYMNSVIASLLYQYSPEKLRFIMIDPKMVELKLFEGIPHLVMPVITDVRMANKALAWVVGEMERRYTVLSSLKCRDLRSYNDRVANNLVKGKDGVSRSMPYMVVLIDELADLMMVAAKDVEDSIIRLTQKARAVGIHVIMATQRPSVDVITALIKANCPARIAFQVSQKTDSRTILDMNGAEALLGKGDMLYRSPVSTGLTRLQAPLISESEIEGIVQETRRHGKPVYIDLGTDTDNQSSYDDDDADEQLFDQALAIILETGKTSTSYVQRRLRIGYNRAANLIELLEDRGYLGPVNGNKPREILKRS